LSLPRHFLVGAVVVLYVLGLNLFAHDVDVFWNQASKLLLSHLVLPLPVVNMCRAFLLVALSGVSAQTLPGAVGPLLSKLRAGMNAVGPTNPDAVRELSEAASVKFGNEVAADRTARLIAAASAEAAAHDVQQFKYGGACVREVTGCPVSWSSGPSGECVPSSGYDGPCVATDVSSMSPAQLEEFAVACKAAWPCKACRTNFAGCPSGWRAVGRLCVAPGGYTGICSPVSDFDGASTIDKASWSATCAARWPCESE